MFHINTQGLLEPVWLIEYSDPPLFSCVIVIFEREKEEYELKSMFISNEFLHIKNIIKKHLKN
jgi:hypothetical protein